MINDLAEKLWAAIQRPSPAVSREEIAAILREGLDAPTADETYGKSYVQESSAQLSDTSRAIQSYFSGEYPRYKPVGG